MKCWEYHKTFRLTFKLGLTRKVCGVVYSRIPTINSPDRLMLEACVHPKYRPSPLYCPNSLQNDADSPFHGRNIQALVHPALLQHSMEGLWLDYGYERLKAIYQMLLYTHLSIWHVWCNQHQYHHRGDICGTASKISNVGTSSRSTGVVRCGQGRQEWTEEIDRLVITHPWCSDGKV